MNRIIIAIVLLIALLSVLGMALNDPTPFEVAGAQEAPDVTPVVGDGVTQSPCEWLDLNRDGRIDITDVGMVVEGYGTIYYLTDIGRVVSQFGQYGMVCL